VILEVLDQPTDRTRIRNLRSRRLITRLPRNRRLGDPPPYLIDKFLQRRRRRLRQRNRGDLIVTIDPRLGDRQQLPLPTRPFTEHEQQLVTGMQRVRRSLDEQLRPALQIRRRHQRRPTPTYLQLVPVPARHQITAGLERLGLLVGGRRHAVAARAARDDHRQRLGARVAFQGVGDVGGRRDAGARTVADEPPEQHQRPVLVRGSDVRLVGDPLRVEGEQVTQDGRGVEQADRRVVGGADREPAERRVRG
jgi:hypothetical protein